MSYNYPSNPFNQEPLIGQGNNDGEGGSNNGNGNSNNPSLVTNFGGAHLTDFTKRKNWPLRVLSELKDFLHVVSPSGRFLFCSPSCQEMVGFTPEELVGRNITDFIHIDDIDTFIRDFNLAITQKQFRLFYRFRKKDDKFVVLEVNGHPYFSDNSTTARCFFIMARPYPSKAASMIDSFLELRMENEILTRRLQELRREADAHTNNESSVTGNPNHNTNLEMQTNSTSNGSGSNLPNLGMNNLSDVSTPIPTKLNNEHNMQVNNQPSELDAGKIKKKPKKNKEKEIHVCTDCGTVDSPEWRKGPQGPKTLCNACGLRYAKKSRKTNLVNELDNQANEE